MAPVRDEMHNGAYLTALALRNLGITTIFGVTGYPITAVLEEAINLGVSFIGFRNEQAASYAATAYGYLTGKPGCCFVVGGPGVVHAMAGVVNSSANCFPMLLIAGASSTETLTRGDFQEADHVALLSPYVKTSIRASRPEVIVDNLHTAYRIAMAGRPGTGFVDIPANLLHATVDYLRGVTTYIPTLPTLLSTDNGRIARVAAVLKAAEAPLVLIGKGASYGQAEAEIRALIDSTQLPFLTSPMGVGVVPSTHPCNTSSARSTALKHADVVLVLGARLNWIFHFGAPPKWNPQALFIQVDIDPNVIGQNRGDSRLSCVADVKAFVPQLLSHLASWSYPPQTPYRNLLSRERATNENKLSQTSQITTQPLKFETAYTTIRASLNALSPPEDGGICYIAEGARTMDLSRSFFFPEHPRLRLDAGTNGTMGVGMGYAIAAWQAYNSTAHPAEARPTGQPGRKKVVCIVGDSAFGFSGMEVETMARYGMDVLIFVMNNGGVYHGHADSMTEFERQREATRSGNGAEGLRSWSLGFEVGYEKWAEAAGGKGFLVRSVEELALATEEGFKAKVPVVVNVLVESGKGSVAVFGFQLPKKQNEGTSGKNENGSSAKL